MLRMAPARASGSRPRIFIDRSAGRVCSSPPFFAYASILLSPSSIQPPFPCFSGHFIFRSTGLSFVPRFLFCACTTKSPETTGRSRLGFVGSMHQSTASLDRASIGGCVVCPSACSTASRQCAVDVRPSLSTFFHRRGFQLRLRIGLPHDNTDTLFTRRLGDESSAAVHSLSYAVAAVGRQPRPCDHGFKRSVQQQSEKQKCRQIR